MIVRLLRASMRHVSEQNFRRRPVERRAIMPLHVSQWSSAFSRMGESHLIFCRGHTDPNILTKARHEDWRGSFWRSVIKNGEGNARKKKSLRTRMRSIWSGY